MPPLPSQASVSHQSRRKGKTKAIASASASQEEDLGEDHTPIHCLDTINKQPRTCGEANCQPRATNQRPSSPINSSPCSCPLPASNLRLSCHRLRITSNTQFSHSIRILSRNPLLTQLFPLLTLRAPDPPLSIMKPVVSKLILIVVFLIVLDQGSTSTI